MDRCAQLAPDAEIADLERLLVAIVAPGSNATRGPQ
jgi:hypothetical protein